MAARPQISRSRRAALARAAVGVVLIVVAALLWLLILTLRMEAVRRSIPPVGVVPATTGWWT
jgi:hypothetical protein